MFDVSKLVAFDLETALVENGLLAPQIICGSVADTEGGRLLTRRAALDTARRLLNSDRIIVGAFIVFDFGCLAAAEPDLLPLIFKAYAEGRVYDVQIAQALHAIAEGNLYLDPRTGSPMRGRYSLATCVSLVLGREDAKINDYWRKRYALLENTPIEEWDEEARQYPVDDAVNTLAVAVAQIQGGGGGITPGPHRNLGDMSPQAETAFALHLGAMWGLRTDPDRVNALAAKTELAHSAFLDRFKSLGFYKPDGKANAKAIKSAVVRAYGGSGKCPAACKSGKVLSEKSGAAINCTACSGTGLDTSAAPRTATGNVSADRDTLVESGDPDLMALGDNEAEKVLHTYLPKLRTEEIGRSLKPNVLVASGRVSYDGLIQLLTKSGGVRECHRARPGYVYCSVDFAALELCAVAQACYWLFGRSQMMETINATGDPGALHTALAASMVGISTEEMMTLIKNKDPEAKNKRAAAKIADFGFGGGMGAAKLVLSQRKKSSGTTTAPDGTIYSGIRFCILLSGEERCGVNKITEWKKRPTPPLCKACVEVVDKELRPKFFKQWPEIIELHKWVSERTEAGPTEMPCLRTERVRGGLDFTNAANGIFQSLASDGAKNALRKLTRECYLDRESVLYGCRPIAFLHDEILAELVEDKAHLAGPRMAEIMIEAMREYLPDVTVRADPALSRFWTKDAEPVYKQGRLVPWENRDEI